MGSRPDGAWAPSIRDRAEGVDDEGDELVPWYRPHFLEPSQRAPDGDPEQRRDRYLRLQLGSVDALGVHVGDQRADQPPAQEVEGGGADLSRGVGTDDRLNDRAGAALVGPGHHHVRHLLQPRILARGPLVILGRHRGDVEIGLATEVAGDEGGVDAGPLADLPDRRALEALLAEEGLRRLEQCLPAGRGIPGPACPGPL
jgi:hypothetical protein